jgi:hypothetical protein
VSTQIPQKQRLTKKRQISKSNFSKLSKVNFQKSQKPKAKKNAPLFSMLRIFK